MSHYESARLCQNDVVASHYESTALVAPAGDPMLLAGLTDTLQGVAVCRCKLAKIRIELPIHEIPLVVRTSTLAGRNSRTTGFHRLDSLGP
jgi:hypothetical protein